MLDFLVKTAQLILSLSILVTLHELGHFLPAKLFKTRVEKFFLFFDIKFSLFKRKIGNTVYGIGWLPFGGYVKIAGMVDESMDKKQLKKPIQSWEFRAKPAWQRLIIMSGGVIINLLLGFAIFIMIVYVNGRTIISNNDLTHGLVFHEVFHDIGFKNGDKILSIDTRTVESINTLNSKFFLHNPKVCLVSDKYGKMRTVSIPENIGDMMWKKGISNALRPRFETVVDSVVSNSPADEVGIQKGDKILSIEGASAKYWDEFTQLVKDYKNQPFKVILKRGNEIQELTLSADEKGIVGIFLNPDQLGETTLNYSFFESIGAGFSLGKEVLIDYIAQFKYLFTSKGVEQIGGIGAMGKMFSSEWNWELFWSNTAFISIMLAFLNILPIPALDGGHILFVLIEMISKRKPSDKFLEYAQVAGFIVLMSLFFYANGNDIYRAIF